MASDGPGTVRGGLRRLTLGRGPLKRGCDRVETASRLLLVLVVLLSVPLAVVAGTVVRADLQVVAGQQADERTPTTAVATDDAPVGSPAGGRAVVPARWTAPDGTAVDGTVRAPAGTRAGDGVDIWTTAEGRRTEPPMTARDVTLGAVVVVTLGELGVLVAAGSVHAAVCWLLGRHRDRRWTRDWAAVEPTWTRRVP